MWRPRNVQHLEKGIIQTLKWTFQCCFKNISYLPNGSAIKYWVKVSNIVSLQIMFSLLIWVKKYTYRTVWIRLLDRNNTYNDYRLSETMVEIDYLFFFFFPIRRNYCLKYLWSCEVTSGNSSCLVIHCKCATGFHHIFNFQFYCLLL